MPARKWRPAAADHEAVRRKVTSQAKAAFFDYFYYDKALQVALKDKDLLQQLSKISEARYRVGKAMQQDVLKSQTEISIAVAEDYDPAAAAFSGAGPAQRADGPLAGIAASAGG